MTERTRFEASYEADRRISRVELLLDEHVKQCDRRAEMAHKLLWFVASLTTAAFGMLIKLAFHL